MSNFKDLPDWSQWILQKNAEADDHDDPFPKWLKDHWKQKMAPYIARQNKIERNRKPGDKVLREREISFKRMERKAEKKKRAIVEDNLPIKKSAREEMFEYLEKSLYEELEKAYVNKVVPKGNCNCGAHSINSNTHYDWCDGLKEPHTHASLINNFLDGLNKETEHKFYPYEVGSHGLFDETDDPDIKNYFPTWKPGDITIFNDHFSDNLQNLHRMRRTRAKDLLGHLDDHHERINKFMDDLGYEPGSDYFDGSGGGDIKGISHWRPKKK